jgi:hypothetical protein
MAIVRLSPAIFSLLWAILESSLLFDTTNVDLNSYRPSSDVNGGTLKIRYIFFFYIPMFPTNTDSGKGSSNRLIETVVYVI